MKNVTILRNPKLVDEYVTPDGVETTIYEDGEERVVILNDDQQEESSSGGPEERIDLDLSKYLDEAFASQLRNAAADLSGSVSHQPSHGPRRGLLGFPGF